VVYEKLHVFGLFKNVQMQGAQKTEPRGVYGTYVERYGLQRNVADERFSTVLLSAALNVLSQSI
jgi:hypothetical protein